jgi:L-ribulose-5-phosphate 3-epimerase
VQLAVSSYSFRRFSYGPEAAQPPDFPEMIERCARLGVPGIELLGVQFPDTAPATLAALKQHALRHGVALVAVSAHHNFVQADPATRAAEVEKLCGWIDVARALGAPAVRAFGGRWSTLPNFAEFMAASGEEPPLPGYTEEDGYAWNAEAFRACVQRAEQAGVTLVLENHWGFTGTAAGVLRILEDVPSPWLRVALDTGNFNFRPEPYAEMAALAPHAAMVHAKTYHGGGIFYTAELDYPRIFGLLRAAGYQGWISLEFEGREHPDTGIPRSLELLRGAMEAG